MRITAQNPIMIKPQLADFLSGLEVGDIVKGKVAEVLAEGIAIRTASGQLFTAALMKAAQLEVGQLIELGISSITDQGVFAELLTEEQKPQNTEDSKLQLILKQMQLKPDEGNLLAAKLLLKNNLPVTKENLQGLLNIQKGIDSLAQGDAAKAAALMQSELDINNTEMAKLAKAAAAFEPESKALLSRLQPGSEALQEVSKASAETEIKSENMQQNRLWGAEAKTNQASKAEAEPGEILKQLAVKVEAEASMQSMPKLERLISTIESVLQSAPKVKPEQTAYMLSKDIKVTPAAIKAMVDNFDGANKLSKQIEALEGLLNQLEKTSADAKEIKQELRKAYLSPEQLEDKSQIANSFKSLIKAAGKLEALIERQAIEDKPDISVLQDIKSSLDIMKSLNTSTNYLQIPLQINDKKTTAEIYVYSGKKRSKAINPENATILIALDLERLGHIESLIAVQGKTVDISFKLEKEEYKKAVLSEGVSLMKALEARGYSLRPLKVLHMKERFSVIEAEASEGIDSSQLHVDIRV